jgi:hypothetical protein
MNSIPVDGLHHISIVVNDARASAQKFASVYGISDWSVRRYDAARLTAAATHGFVADQQYLTATGVAESADGPVTFVLVQPVAGWTTYHEFLNQRGEGVHSICTAAVTPAALAELAAWLAARDVPVAQVARRNGNLDVVLFDTRAKLGGFYIEILAEHAAGAASEPVDEVWHLRENGAARPPLLRLGGIKHFGVVIPDLPAAVRAYSELFGITAFSFRNWHPGPDSLSDPFYLGKPVNHAYFTTMVTPHERVAFEVIQPTFGPSHYKEDYLQLIGPGIHHLHCGMLDDAAEYAAVKERTAAAGIAEVMGGGIFKSFLDFYYLDTRAALAGYVTEYVVPGKNFAAGRPNVPFAMTADLSQPAAGYAISTSAAPAPSTVVA